VLGLSLRDRSASTRDCTRKHDSGERPDRALAVPCPAMAPLGALSQAWVSAEASLPLGWQLVGVIDITLAPYEGLALPDAAEPAKWAAIAMDDGVDRAIEVGWGEHPTQALNRLADVLRDRRSSAGGE